MTKRLSKLQRVQAAAREFGHDAAQKIADEIGVGLYISAQWPDSGEVWAIRKGQWYRQIGHVFFKKS